MSSCNFVNVGIVPVIESFLDRKLLCALCRLVHHLKHSGVRQVYVASVVERGAFPGFTGLSRAQFNKIRKVSDELARYFGEDFVDVGSYR